MVKGERWLVARRQEELGGNLLVQMPAVAPEEVTLVAGDGGME